MMQYDHLLEVAVRAAKESGALALEMLGKTTASLKSATQVLTEADIKCQAGIIEILSGEFGDYGILAEEGADGNLFRQEPRGDQDNWWVIDPIDGTRNFAHGLNQFSVSIGLISNGMPVLGVIYVPASQDVYTAYQGGVTKYNGLEVCCVEENFDLNSLFVLPGHYGDGLPAIVQRLFERHSCLNLGSAAMHLAYVASGQVLGTFSWDVRLWDIAAGAALLNSAGGIITGHDGEDVFPFDCRNYKGHAIPTVIGAKKTHEYLKGMLGPKRA